MTGTREPISTVPVSGARYGSSICTRHEIAHWDLEQLLLGDPNRLLSAAGDLRLLAAEALPKAKPRGSDDGSGRCRPA